MNSMTELPNPVGAQYVDCPSCKIHQGMKRCKEGTINQVMNAVKSMKSKLPDYDIILTGHSLGAAVATLSAIDLIKNGTSVSLYTFGSPRVGNKEFSDYVSSLFSTLSNKYNSYRFTHSRDIIPHVPYASMGYEHINTEIYEDATHMLTTCSAGGPEDSTCGSQQWSFIQCDIQDHLFYLDLYMDCSYA